MPHPLCVVGHALLEAVEEGVVLEEEEEMKMKINESKKINLRNGCVKVFYNCC